MRRIIIGMIPDDNSELTPEDENMLLAYRLGIITFQQYLSYWAKKVIREQDKGA